MKNLYIVDDSTNTSVYQIIFPKNKQIDLKEVSPTTLSSEKIQRDKLPKILGIAKPKLIDWVLDSTILNKIPNIVGICTKSSWKEYIDLKYCQDNNIKVLNNVGINSRSVAEYAIFQMLALARNLPQQIKNDFNEKTCITQEHTEIENKIAGIIGLGNIGSHIAKICNGLGMKVRYWSRENRNDQYQFLKLHDLLKSSDFIFNCVETSEETRDFLDKTKLNLMKSTTYFISVLGGCGWKNVQDDYHLIEMVKKTNQQVTVLRIVTTQISKCLELKMKIYFFLCLWHTILKRPIRELKKDLLKIFYQ